MSEQMTTEDAVRYMRGADQYRNIIEEAYLDEDSQAAVERFERSVEFRETLRLLPTLTGLTVVDLGAGTGLASQALAMAGAGQVLAIEPELSEVVGLGALAPAAAGLRIAPVASLGGGLPIRSATVDVVYCRQVLHHIPDLEDSLLECARVLRPGGWFVATREHVVNDARQLEVFLANHPVHQLAGGENAWSLDTYRRAILGADLEMRLELGPWDSVVNAYPTVNSSDELRRAPELILARRGGVLLGKFGTVPGVSNLVWRWLRRRKAGRLYSFVACKPGPSGGGLRLGPPTPARMHRALGDSRPRLRQPLPPR